MKMKSDNYINSNKQNIQAMKRALRVAKTSLAERGKIGVIAIVPEYNKEGNCVKWWWEIRSCNNLADRIVANGRTKCETEAPTVEESHTLPEVLHAEEMLVCNCALEGWSLKDATIFITRTPCKKCAAHLIQAGIKKLYYYKEHPHGDGLPLLEEANIPYEELNFEQGILEEKYL